MASTNTTPAQNAISSALKAAKINTTKGEGLIPVINYEVPNQATIDGWTSHFVPGISKEYNDYFDALINAAKAEYGPTAVQVGDYIAQKAAWQDWAKSHTNLTGLDLSNTKGKTYNDALAQANTVKQILSDQTKVVNDAAKLGTSALQSSLYGIGGSEDKPAKNSIAANYSAAQAALTKAQNAYDKKPTVKGQETLTKAQNAFDTSKTAYESAQQAIASNSQGKLTPTESALYNSYTTYLDKAYTPFTNFLSGTPTVDTPAGTDPLDAKVSAAVESYKTKGYMPTVDSAILGQVQSEIDKYEQKKAEDAARSKAIALQADSPQKIAQVKNDIANYNALLAQAAKSAPKIGESTTDVLKKMNAAKGETTPNMALPDLIKTNAQHPAPSSQIPQLGLNLSQDFNTRMIQQDLAAQQQIKNPGTYASGQFDPLYSGYLSVGNNYATEDSKMLPGGTWAGGPQVMHSSGIGLGIQNAFDPNSFNPNAVTGKAAGGYLDAQSVGQSNQAMQQQPNNQLGLASIPNMSQYTNYTGNPGITSPTQNTDDGGVGGVSVLGQTNPVW